MTVLITSAAICASTREARAGSMTLPARGVRTVERAGALIAGADDADSLWLDPAGLAHLAGDGRTELRFDIAYVAQSVDYARIDSGENRLASVSNQQSGSPIPTVAATLGIGDRLVLAGDLAAPYAGPPPPRRRWPAALRVSQPRVPHSSI